MTLRDNTCNATCCHDSKISPKKYIRGINETYGIYLSNVGDIFERLMGSILKMDRRKLKLFVDRAIDIAIDKLTDIQFRIGGERPAGPATWNVWILNTDTHLAVVAAREGVTEMIPEDGSFINGVILYKGLTEKAAHIKVNEIESKLSPSEDSEPNTDLS